MSDFRLTVGGTIDVAAARAAFEGVVGALADAINLDGSLVIDGEPIYNASEALDALTSSEEEAAPEESAEEEAAPEA